MKKYYMRKEVEKILPVFDQISFTHWILVARIDPAQKRNVGGHLTYFYTLPQIKKLERLIRARKPGLFKQVRQEVLRHDAPTNTGVNGQE
jgi:hypothetical protein